MNSLIVLIKMCVKRKYYKSIRIFFNVTSFGVLNNIYIIVYGFVVFNNIL